MRIADPDYRARIAELFGAADFIRHVGAHLLDCGPGWCEAEILLAAHHRQQNGYVHAGVQDTLADHTAGSAAATLMAPGRIVLTLELRLQLLRAAQGERLHCRAEVIKAGSQFSMVEAAVYAWRNGEPRLVSKLGATMAYIDAPAGG